LKKTFIPRKWLTELRESKGMSINELADATDISGTYIRVIEKGRQTPRFPIALKIGRVLGISDEEIFSRFYIKPPESKTATDTPSDNQKAV
jgi:DNA-binding XRE family transcriptional regulator